MCNLYNTRSMPAKVASFFSAKIASDFNAGEGEV
jgi:hypothetical protein